jgi:hypothetical protein
MRILFGIVIVIPFFFLPFWWAVFAIIFVAGITPLISMLFYSPFRKFLFFHSNIKDFISGGIESLVFFLLYYLISRRFIIPKHFLLFTIIGYSINQLNRVYRDPLGHANIDELKELIGFYMILIIVLVLRLII